MVRSTISNAADRSSRARAAVTGVERQQNVRHESSDGSLGGPEGSVGRLPVCRATSFSSNFDSTVRFEIGR